MKYKVMEIQEDVDFGCEERSEGSPVMAVVLLRGEDGSEMMTRQADQMGSYNAFVVPLSDLSKVFNFKASEPGGDELVKLL